MGVLIFIEAIAWFLLKQYRAIIQDYKFFHKMYLKRANYLIAYRTISGKEDVSDQELIFITSLLSEDLSEKLKEGESTESLENLKSPTPNPIFSVLSNILARKENPKP